MSLVFPLFVSVFVFVFVFVPVFVFVFVFWSEFGALTSLAFRKYTVWGVPEAWRQCYSSSMNSGKIVAGRDGTSKVLQEVLADLKIMLIKKQQLSQCSSHCGPVIGQPVVWTWARRWWQEQGNGLTDEHVVVQTVRKSSNPVRKWTAKKYAALTWNVK